MRHKQKSQKLSRFSSYYQATIRSLARSVLLHQRIVTTKIRAKLARPMVDRLISWGKQLNSLSARRQAYAVLNDHELVRLLFTQISPRFSEMKGGYTRIIPYKHRRGDNAELVVLELSAQAKIERPAKEEKAAKKPAVPKAKPAAAPEPETKEARPERKDVAPPDKEKHRKEKEQKKPPKNMLGGFQKFFKSERDSL